MYDEDDDFYEQWATECDKAQETAFLRLVRQGRKPSLHIAEPGDVFGDMGRDYYRAMVFFGQLTWYGDVKQDRAEAEIEGAELLNEVYRAIEDAKEEMTK